MFPLVFLVLLVGGAYALSRRKVVTYPEQCFGPGCVPALNPAPSSFEGREGAAIFPLPPDLRIQVAQVLASNGDPNLVDELARRLREGGFQDASTLLAEKAQDLRMSGPAAAREMFVLAPHGLNVRAEPRVGAALLGNVPFGRTVRVTDMLPSGWAQIRSLTTANVAYVCNTCPEAGGGPWLVESPPASIPQFPQIPGAVA